MRSKVLPLVAVAVLVASCSKPAPGVSADAAPSAAPSTASTQAFRPRPEDIDVPRVREPLKCAPGSKKPVCALLADFEKADTWNLDTIRSGDARYFGLATIIEKGQTRSAYVFVIVKKVPTNDVPAGDLPIKVAVRELEAGLKQEQTHAPKLMRGLESDDLSNKYNATLSYLKSYAPANWDGANVTTGPSTILHSEGGVYVRESKVRKLYLVRLAAMAPDSQPGDGTYAMLHPVTW
jgi:hypothetical protein